MFENFNNGNFGEYLSDASRTNKLGLIKSNFLPEVTEVIDTKSELFKGYDPSKEEYSEYLSKQRGEKLKNVPLYKCIKLNMEVSDNTAPDDGLFKGQKFLEEVNLGKTIQDNADILYKNNFASVIWEKEAQNEVLAKTYQKLDTIYQEIVVGNKELADNLTVEDLAKSVSEKGYNAEASKSIAVVLHKAYLGFKKLEHKLEEEGKSEESAKKIAAYVGRKKYGKSGMAKLADAGRNR